MNKNKTKIHMLTVTDQIRPSLSVFTQNKGNHAMDTVDIHTCICLLSGNASSTYSADVMQPDVSRHRNPTASYH